MLAVDASWWRPTLASRTDRLRQLPQCATESRRATGEGGRPKGERWETREELRLAIVVWIETKYNRRRRQRGA